MRTILILCGLILVLGLSVLVALHQRVDHYGQPFKGFPVAAVSDLVDKPDEFIKKNVRIEGPVERQCASTGCWFFLSGPGKKEVKVEMGDTTPHLPARLGKRATVEGQLIKFGKDYEFIGTAVEFH